MSLNIRQELLAADQVRHSISKTQLLISLLIIFCFPDNEADSINPCATHVTGVYLDVLTYAKWWRQKSHICMHV